MPRPALLCLMLLAGACASSTPVPRPFPSPADRPPDAPPGVPVAEGAAPPAAYAGSTIVATALALLGTPYRNGGADPEIGFDCSGFVWYVFATHGLAVPRNVTEQYRAGQPVEPDVLAPGDLVFFSTVAEGPSHVGISIGGDDIVHAPSSSGQVRVERLSAGYWSSRYVGAKRIAAQAAHP